MEPGFDYITFGAGVVTGLVLGFLLRLMKGSGKQGSGMPPPLPVSIPAKLHPKVRQLRAEGREIEAIKLVREATGCGLMEARLAVQSFR
jgi:hypothetical protein